MPIAVALAIAVARRWFVWLSHLLWFLRRTVVVAPLLSQRSRCPGRQHRPNQQCHYNSFHFFHNFLAASVYLAISRLKGEAGSLRCPNFSNLGARQHLFDAQTPPKVDSQSKLLTIFASNLRISPVSCCLEIPRTHPLGNGSHLIVHDYRRKVTLILPTLLLLSNARSEIVCSPAPLILRSSE